jgi:hypothetical protein
MSQLWENIILVATFTIVCFLLIVAVWGNNNSKSSDTYCSYTPQTNPRQYPYYYEVFHDGAEELNTNNPYDLRPKRDSLVVASARRYQDPDDLWRESNMIRMFNDAMRRRQENKFRIKQNTPEFHANRLDHAAYVLHDMTDREVPGDLRVGDRRYAFVPRPGIKVFGDRWYESD